jgi:hypothetical protein
VCFDPGGTCVAFFNETQNSKKEERGMAERYSERGDRRWDDERRGDREWGYGSRARDYSRDYRGQDRGGDDRGFFDRAGDEVRSWFGDEDAQRRRMRDEREDYRGERGERRDWGSRESYRGRSDWGGQDFDPREWSRQWGYVEGRGSGSGMGERGRDWTRGGGADWTRGSGSGYGRGGYGGAGSGQGTYGGYGAYGRERDWGGEQDWGGQGPGGFGVYRGTLSEQRESGGSGRGDREWGRFSGGESYGTGPYVGRGPRNYQRSDERIREEICERLAHHPNIDATDLEVRVQNAEVTLQGQVNDRWAKRWAEDVAEGIWGVKEVHNQVRVSQSQLGQEHREGQQQEGQRTQAQQQQRGPWAA